MSGLSRVTSRLLYKYIVSYLMVFLIPFIITSAIIYHNSVSSLRQEIEQSNINNLEQVKNMTDERMEELETIAARISYDPRLTPYMIKHDYYSREAINELKKYKANSSIIEEVFVYYHQNDKIYSTGGSYSVNTFTEKMYQSDALKKDDLIIDLQTKFPMIRLAENVSISNDKNERMISYLYPIAPNSLTPYGTVIYFIEESVITNLIRNILGDYKGSTFIFNEENQIVASSINDKEIDQESVLLQTKNTNGINNVNINGKDYSIVSVKSDVSGWTFMTVMDTDQFFASVVHMQTFIVLVLISVVLIGSVVAIVFGRIQYKPIQNLSELIKMKGKLNLKFQGRNELETIRNVISRVLEDHQNLSETAYLQKPFAKGQILAKLLKGDLVDNEKIDVLLKSLNINMKDGLYFVIILTFDKVSMEKDSTERQRAFNLMSEISFQGSIAYGTDLLYNDALALIVSMDEKTGNLKDQRQMFVTKVKQYIQDTLLIPSIIGVGGLYNDKSKISRSFIEALATMEYKFINPQGSIIYFEDISSQQGQTIGYPKEEQLKFVQSLKQGNKVVAVEALNNMFSSLSNEKLSLPVLKCVCFDIVNTVLKTTSEIGLSDQIHEVEKIVDFTSIEQLKKDLDRIVVKICKDVEVINDSQNSRLINDILGYIKNKYQAYDLSLESTAEHFKVSVSFLSRFIKEQTGVTFTQCVLGFRMEELKQQLRKTDTPIKQIINDVGYNDAANFTRKFKQIEGITPGQYRKLNR